MTSREVAPQSPAGAALTDLLLTVFRLNGRVLAAGDQLVADLGLTSARWQVLGAIAVAGNQLPVAHIAHNMGLTRQAVGRVVNELAADGLVAFGPNPYHQRAPRVVLTDAGHAAYQAAMDRQVPWAAALTDQLDEDEINQATRLLRTLLTRLESSPNKKGEATHGKSHGNGSPGTAGQTDGGHRRASSARQHVQR